MSNWSVPAYACCFSQWKGYCGLPRRLHLLYIFPLRNWRELTFTPASSSSDWWPDLLGLSLYIMCSSTLTIVVALLWSFFFMSVSSTHWVAQNCTQFSRCGLTSTPWMEITTFLNMLAIFSLLQPRMLLTFFVATSLLNYLLLAGTHKFLFGNSVVLASSS